MRTIVRILLLGLMCSLLALDGDAFGRDAKGRFVVVIDPGHGGHDSGALGRKIYEKTVTLNVALKVGEYIKSLDPSIIVHYTRRKDVFIGLNERADFANNKKADLFVSIHANSAGLKNPKAKGTETYVLGLARTAENLAVAMKENAAILKEDNYTQKYEGFDPNSTESYIIFEFMQNKHLESSLDLAQRVHKGLVGRGFHNRGVRQAGFLVLRRTSMPSILIELGFVTNPSDEAYMGSAKGVDEMGRSIAGAIVAYAEKICSRDGSAGARQTRPTSVEESPTVEEEAPTPVEMNEVETPTPPTPTAVETKGKVTYRVQVYASDKPVKNTAKTFKGYQKHLNHFKEGKMHKYTLYDVGTLKEAQKLQKELNKKYKGCFVVKFIDGKKA